MLYNALSVGMKTPKIAPSPWDFVTREKGTEPCTVIGNTHKYLVKIVSVVREISSRTDRRAHYNTLPPLRRRSNNNENKIQSETAEFAPMLLFGCGRSINLKVKVKMEKPVTVQWGNA